MKLLVINGPNLNFLGIREPDIYGKENYDYLLGIIAEKAKELGVDVEVFQSNHEGAIIDRIQDAYMEKIDGILINPGAYTHYSYAIFDALKSIGDIPKVEVHISDINAREDFRKQLITTPASDKVIAGRGLKGYLDGIDELMDMIKGR